MHHLNNNFHSAVPPLIPKSHVDNFFLMIDWAFPMRIIISNNMDSQKLKNFLKETINSSLREKPLKEILPFLQLEFEGIGRLMHFLVWNKHLTTYKDASANLKIIEEKCEQELSVEQKEHYLFVKNYEGLTYKELDQKLQDEKIKSIAFSTLQQNLEKAMDIADRNQEIFCDAQIMVDLCKKRQIDQHTLYYRADRTDDGDSPLFIVGDTLLNIAARLYLRGQLRPDFIYLLCYMAFLRKLHGGNRFLKASSIEKITKSEEEKKRLTAVFNEATLQCPITLIEFLCQNKIQKETVFANLQPLFTIPIKNENFFHSFIRKFWEECLTVHPEMYFNVFTLIKTLKNCANSKWIPISKICQSILEHKNRAGKTLETLHHGCALAAANLHPSHFLKIFFTFSSTFEDSLLFNFRIDNTTQVFKRAPTYIGDTLLHIAVRLYQLNIITVEFIEKIIDRAIFASIEQGRTFLEARNCYNIKYSDIHSFFIVDEKLQNVLESCLIKSLMNLVDCLYSGPFEEIKDIFLRNLDLINDHLVARGLMTPRQLIDGRRLSEINLSQLIQLLKEQIDKKTKYALQSLKFLKFINHKENSLSFSLENQQLLHSHAKIILSAWESMLITSLTEEAREQLANNEDKGMIITKLMKKALETRKQKILHEPNSLVEAKFTKKLTNSIKKLY